MEEERVGEGASEREGEEGASDAGASCVGGADEHSVAVGELMALD